jgi:uncharacterized protein YceK
MKVLLVLLAATAVLVTLAGCGTLSGHGMASSGDNWYKPGASQAQATADLETCRERSGYGGKLFLTEMAANSYNSYIDTCMARAGYDWYRDDRNPRGGAPAYSSPGSTTGSTGSTGSTGVRSLGK